MRPERMGIVTEQAPDYRAVARSILARQPAMAPGDLSKQLEIAAHAKRPSGRDGGALGWRLLAEGLIDEAGEIFHALARQFTKSPAGSVGCARVAMRRRAWSEALVFWDDALARFGKLADWKWFEGRSWVLYGLGRLDDAESSFADLAKRFPSEPDGHVGLAQVAMQRRNWATALAHWDDAIALSRAPVESAWYLGRANVLVRLNRVQEADRELSRLVSTDREPPALLLGLAHTQFLMNHPEEALRRLDRTSAVDQIQYEFLNLKFRILVRLRRLDDARALSQRILRDTQDPRVLPVLFAFSPLVRQRAQREQYWRALLRRAADLLRDTASPEKRSLLSIRLRLLLALRDYRSFLEEFELLDASSPLGEHGPGLVSVAAKLRDPDLGALGRPRVFGVGLSRTGTNTLAAALTDMGLFTAHFANPLTLEFLGKGDFDLLDAATDTPVCDCVEYLYQRFPAAKFVYTTRPFPDWESSLTALFSLGFGCDTFTEMKTLIDRDDVFLYGPVFADMLRSLYFRYDSYEQAYFAYDRRIREFFRDKPADRFLEFDVFSGDGWSKLAPFVGRPAPGGPFPWRNRRPS
jgi:tetratricopeptide (TPR) repeat protein